MKDRNVKKKLFIIGTIVLVVLLMVGIFLYLFFNRKYEIIFDYNNGAAKEVVYVKYNKKVTENDIKDKEELGDKFINWYEVIGEEDGQDILAEKPFNFKNKINKKFKLKAVYNGELEKITIIFDSSGGSKVENLIIAKGVKLSLPKNPTKNGYTFDKWIDKNKMPVLNGALLEENTTLYAVWIENEAEEVTNNNQNKVEESK